MRTRRNKVQTGGFWTKHASAISVGASIIAIIVALTGAFQYVNTTIERTVKEQTKVYTELLTAIFVQQANSPYDAARRFRKIYESENARHYTQDLREALVTGLLQSIADSGFPEEFEGTVEAIREDKLVSLQRFDLNNIGAIYIQLGYTKHKAIEVLSMAADRIERGNEEPKTTKATSHWLLALAYLANGDVDEAALEVKKANALKPDNFRLQDLKLITIDDAKEYIRDFTIFERIEIKNADLPNLLVQLSSRLDP